LRRRATSAVWTVSPFEQEITSNVFGQAGLIWSTYPIKGNGYLSKLTDQDKLLIALAAEFSGSASRH